MCVFYCQAKKDLDQLKERMSGTKGALSRLEQSYKELYEEQVKRNNELRAEANRDGSWKDFDIYPPEGVRILVCLKVTIYPLPQSGDEYHYVEVMGVFTLDKGLQLDFDEKRLHPYGTVYKYKWRHVPISPREQEDICDVRITESGWSRMSKRRSNG